MTDPSDNQTPVPEPSESPPESPAVSGSGTTNWLQAKTKTKVKGALAKLWSSGGGGFYGLGYLITFLWLEVQLIIREIAGAEGIVDFVTSQLIERVFRVVVDSLMNSIKAFLWPVYLLSQYELWGIGALLLGSVLYTRFVHRHIVRYLGVDPEAEKKAKKVAKKAAQQAK